MEKRMYDQTIEQTERRNFLSFGVIRKQGV